MKTQIDFLKPPATDRWIIAVSLTALSGIFGYFLIYIYHRFNQGHLGDFPTFYHAARAMLAGRDPYVPVEDNLAYVYPPLLAWLFIPFATLSKINAARIVFPVNLASALIALFVAALEWSRLFGIRPLTFAGLCAICALTALMGENELRGQLQQMETDALMLLMFTLALRWLDRHPFRCGMALAVAMNIKYLSLVFLPYLLLRRRWHAAIGMVVWTICFALLPAITIGWKEDLRCLRVALGGLLGWIGIHPATSQSHFHPIHSQVSISATSGLARAMRDHHLPGSYALIAAITLIALSILIVWGMYQKRGFPMWQWPDAGAQSATPFCGLVGLEWLGLIAAALVFSPHTNTRHMILAIPLEAAAAMMLLIPRPGVNRLPLLLATTGLILGFAMPFRGVFSDGFTHAYFKYSLVSWCLLGMYFMLLRSGLQYISSPLIPEGIGKFSRLFGGLRGFLPGIPWLCRRGGGRRGLG